MLNRLKAPYIHPAEEIKIPQLPQDILPNGIKLTTLSQNVESVSKITFSWNKGLSEIPDLELFMILSLLLPKTLKSDNKQSIEDLLEEKGAWLQIDYFQHEFAISVSALNEEVPHILPYIVSLITKPKYLRKQLKRVIDQLVVEIKLNNKKPKYLAQNLNRQILWGEEHPLSRIPTIERLNNITTNDVISLHKQIMLQSPPSVYLSGNIDQKLLQLISTGLSDITFSQRFQGPLKVIKGIPIKSTVKEHINLKESLQTSINISIAVDISRTDPQYPRLKYAVFALGGFFNSRLMSNIREDKGYTYGITASLRTTHEGTFINILCECDKAYVNPVLKEIDNEITRLASIEMNAQEFNEMKAAAISQVTNALDSPFSLMEVYRNLDYYNLDVDLYNQNISQLFALTPSELLDTFAKFVRNAPIVTVTAGA